MSLVKVSRTDVSTLRCREVYGVDVSVAAAHLPVLLLHGGKDLIVPFQKVLLSPFEELERACV